MFHLRDGTERPFGDRQAENRLGDRKDVLLDVTLTTTFRANLGYANKDLPLLQSTISHVQISSTSAYV